MTQPKNEALAAEPAGAAEPHREGPGRTAEAGPTVVLEVVRGGRVVRYVMRLAPAVEGRESPRRRESGRGAR